MGHQDIHNLLKSAVLAGFALLDTVGTSRNHRQSYAMLGHISLQYSIFSDEINE